MNEKLPIEQFLVREGLLLDVRSPGEFSHASLPTAINLPLFSDKERAAVGTTYKTAGQQAALCLGLEYVGPKMRSFVETALNLKSPLRIYCWRGGLRSSSMAWLLNTAGIKTYTLQGGYKSFRRMALELFAKPFKYHLIGGFTGSGKTAFLHNLRKSGEQVLDLEGLASHRGSAFGDLGQSQQPTNEHFENLIAMQLSGFDEKRPVFVEDESRMIGKCKLPDALFTAMQISPFYFLERKNSERLANLIREYGQRPLVELENATRRLEKKLGSAQMNSILNYLHANELEKATLLLLEYYDKSYSRSIAKRGKVPTRITPYFESL